MAHKYSWKRWRPQQAGIRCKKVEKVHLKLISQSVLLLVEAERTPRCSTLTPTGIISRHLVLKLGINLAVFPNCLLVHVWNKRNKDKDEAWEAAVTPRAKRFSLVQMQNKSRFYRLTHLLMLQKKKNVDRIFSYQGSTHVVFVEKNHCLENKPTNLQLYSHFQTA